MTDKVKIILDKAATTASNFHKEMKAYGEVLIASAPMIEVTEEMNDLYLKALEVLFDSDLDTKTLEHITGLIGSEGASDLRQWRNDMK